MTAAGAAEICPPVGPVGLRWRGLADLRLAVRVHHPLVALVAPPWADLTDLPPVVREHHQRRVWMAPEALMNLMAPVGPVDRVGPTERLLQVTRLEPPSRESM